MRTFVSLSITLLILVASTDTTAQITITSADFNSARQIGASIKSYASTPGEPLHINIGTPSSSAQTWDFSAIPMTLQLDATVIDPTTAPHHTLLPDADHVRCGTMAGVPGAYYQYHRITNNEYLLYGFGFEDEAEPTTYDPPVPQIKFPCTLGKSWTYTGESHTPLYVSKQRLTWTVDAFGTMITTRGTYQVLRMKTEMVTEWTSSSGSTVQRSINYNYSNKGTFVLWIGVDTTAPTSGVVPAYGMGCDVVSGGMRIFPLQPSEYFLGQNYPNPFSTMTTIDYSLDTQQYVRLELLNLFGQTVATLIDEVKDKGRYRFTLTTESLNISLPSGMYFYRLMTPSGTILKKMHLVR